MGNNALHEYYDKNGDLVRVRESRTGEIYIDSYTGDERNPEGHGTNHSPLMYGN